MVHVKRVALCERELEVDVVLPLADLANELGVAALDALLPEHPLVGGEALSAQPDVEEHELKHSDGEQQVDEEEKKGRA